MKNERNYGYDIIRIISCFLVIFYHYCVELSNCVVVSNVPFLFSEKTSGYISNLAVICFFMLSGSCIWLGNKDTSIKVFYKKRILAIYPAFWISYLIVQGMKIIINKSILMGKNPILYILSFLGIDGYFYYLSPNYYCLGEWFLGAIIIAYSIFPLIRYCFFKIRWILLSLLFIFFSMICFTNFFQISPIRNIISVIFCFYLGMLFEEYKEELYCNKIIRIITISLCIVFMFLSRTIDNLLVRTLFSVFLFYSISWFIKIIQNNFSVKLRKIILFFSNITYAIFLTHHIVINFFTKRLLLIIGSRDVRICIVFLIISLITIILSWILTVIIKKITVYFQSRKSNAIQVNVQQNKNEFKDIK